MCVCVFWERGVEDGCVVVCVHVWVCGCVGGWVCVGGGEQGGRSEKEGKCVRPNRVERLELDAGAF